MRRTYYACGAMEAAFAVAVGRAPRRAHRGDSSLGRPPAAVDVVDPASLSVGARRVGSHDAGGLKMLRKCFSPSPGLLYVFGGTRSSEKNRLVRRRPVGCRRAEVPADGAVHAQRRERVHERGLVEGQEEGPRGRDHRGLRCPRPPPSAREDLLGAAAGRFQRISEREIRARQISRAEKLSESFGQLRGFGFMGMFHAGCLVQRFSEILREVRTREFGAPRFLVL